jgi:hypothetical protein
MNFSFLLGWACGVGGTLLLLFVLIFRISYLLPAAYHKALVPAALTRHRIEKKLRKRRRKALASERKSAEEEEGGGSSSSSSNGNEWFNVLARRLFRAYATNARTAEGNEALLAALNAKIAAAKLPVQLAVLSVTEVDVGGAPPMLTNIELVESRGCGAVVWRGELVYTGDAHASIVAVGQLGTRTVPDVVSLPVEVGLSDLVLRVPLLIELSAEDVVRMSFSELPELNFELQTEFGYKVTITDVPHLKLLIRHHFAKLTKQFVYPAVILEMKLPMPFPSSSSSSSPSSSFSSFNLPPSSSFSSTTRQRKSNKNRKVGA